MHTAGAMLHAWFRAGLDFLYPPHCLWCADMIASPNYFCGRCHDALILPASQPRCCRCSAPVGPYLGTAENCIHCRADPYAFDRVVSLGPHDEELKHACRLAKAATGAILTHALTVQLWEHVQAHLNREEFDLIVPVPHHWSERLLSNHFPSELAAQSMSRLSSVPTRSDGLRKVRRTPKQTDLSPTERRKNLRDAFQASSSLVGGQQILLVDDVLTTGTTAHQATKALLSAGARKVFVAVFSRGVGR